MRARFTLGLTYFHLNDDDVRAAAISSWLSEWDELIATWPRGKCYGKQLTESGWEAFEQAMPRALRENDDEWLIGQMSSAGYWEPLMARRKPKGGITMVDYNKRDALERLCFGEFNIAYIRGVATALLARGEAACIVYRAGASMEPRSECTGWEGQRFPLLQVLDGHRARYHPPPGNRAAWSIPTGPNCHHSIRSIDSATG